VFFIFFFTLRVSVLTALKFRGKNLALSQLSPLPSSHCYPEKILKCTRAGTWEILSHPPDLSPPKPAGAQSHMRNIEASRLFPVARSRLIPWNPAGLGGDKDGGSDMLKLSALSYIPKVTSSVIFLIRGKKSSVGGFRCWKCQG
jgi:hypothetical protein